MVWKAIDREEGIEVAWNSFQTTRTEVNEITDEVEILKKVCHPNIITFLDSWYSNGEFVFITELMTSGTLREYVQKMRTTPIKVAKRWSRQILKGLIYLHTLSPPIIHRDLKCDNLFINGSHGEVKIGDMGTAKMRFGKKYTVIGTPEFMAPEMYDERGYNEKADIYAFGMCLLEMITGEYPYSECKNAAQIYKKVSMGTKPECLVKVQDKEMLALINLCIGPANERWSAKKLLEHPFLIEEPEVILMSVNDDKTRLKLQVLFKGADKHSIKFEYNRETDTAEDVVKEMITEKVLSSKYQGLVCNEIHRILRELQRSAHQPQQQPNEGGSNPTTTSISSNGNASQSIAIPQGANSHATTIYATETANRAVNFISTDILGTVSPGVGLHPSESFDSESSQKSKATLNGMLTEAFDFHLNMPIEEFIAEVAAFVHRPLEKAAEWLAILKSQDLMTVGDLCALLDEDWNRLGMTVFATRAIRNSLKGAKLKPSLPAATVTAEMLTPRISSEASGEPTSSIDSYNSTANNNSAILPKQQ